MQTVDRLKNLEVFLKRWPIETIESMQLKDYIVVGGKDTFTYWLEFRQESYGSIRGAGSAEKFGIYQQKNIKDMSGKKFKKHSSNHYV